MTRSRQSKFEKQPVRPTAAWRAAEAAGIDMVELERSFRRTPSERMIEHQRALEILEQLKKAKVKVPRRITIKQVYALRDRHISA